jgi:glucose dehydrogenase
MRNSNRLLAVLFGASALLSAPAATAAEQAFVPVSDAMLANPDPAEWLMVSRTYNEQRFSPLNQITKANVSQLRMAWARQLPNGTQESTPIVYRGVMYLFAPGGTIQAVNATNGDLIWEYARKYPALCAAQRRGERASRSTRT